MTSSISTRSLSGGSTVVRNGLVLTSECPHTLLKKDILIEGERIACIGEDMPPDVPELDASGMIVIPGFVDAHRHCWQGALRGAAIDTDLMGYFRRAPHYLPEDVHVGTLASALDAINAGITTIYDWAHIVISLDHANAGIEALSASGIRAIWGYGFPNTRPEWSWHSDLPLPHAEARHIRRTRLSSDDEKVTMGLALRGPELSNMAVVESDWALAQELAIPPSVHSGNSPAAMADEPIARLRERGLLLAGAHYVHTNWLSAEDRRRIAGSGGSVVVTPSVEMAMGFGQPASQVNLDAGLKPGLGVDVTTTASGDMFSKMRATLWSSRMSDRSSEPSVCAADVFSFATIKSARSIGLGERDGFDYRRQTGRPRPLEDGHPVSRTNRSSRLHRGLRGASSRGHRDRRESHSQARRRIVGRRYGSAERTPQSILCRIARPRTEGCRVGSQSKPQWSES